MQIPAQLGRSDAPSRVVGARAGLGREPRCRTPARGRVVHWDAGPGRTAPTGLLVRAPTRSVRQEVGRKRTGPRGDAAWVGEGEVMVVRSRRCRASCFPSEMARPPTWGVGGASTSGAARR